jgi:hypothetical protein
VDDPSHALPARPSFVPECIISVTRGETQEVYRVRLLDDGSACSERVDEGGPATMRVFRGDGTADGFDATEPNTRSKMDRAVRYIGRYLDGTVNVGERDLLSPTSALTRNVRWFSGDIQMLHTAFFYFFELFPSAQFHVGQLFRRVFGDVAFGALLLVTSAFLLRTDAPVALKGLAVALQVVSLIAIVGMRRFVKPLLDRWQILRATAAGTPFWRLAYLLPVLIVSQLSLGAVGVLRNTLIGLANLAIHPPKVFESWRKVRRGSSLDWRASSVAVGQDMRGWPLSEYVDVYWPATRAGLLVVALAVSLIAVGAPLTLLGLNGVGFVAAALITAVLYAWHAGLPRSEHDGLPLYSLASREYGALAGAGAASLAGSYALWRMGIYPLPGFEGSVGVVFLFLSASAAFAVAFPTYYVARWPVERGRAALRRVVRLGVVTGCGGIALLMGAAIGEPARVQAALGAVRSALHFNERSWRVPSVEQGVYDRVAAMQRVRANVDPDPLLRAEGDQATFQARSMVATVDRRDLRGIPPPRLPSLAPLDDVTIPALYPLPLRERIALGKPKREFLLPMGQSLVSTPLPVPVGRRAEAEARLRAASATPRVLSPSEVAVEDAFIAGASYPWIGRDELRALASPNNRGERLPILEMARAYRWDLLKEVWDRVPAAGRGEAPNRVRLDRLVDAADGVASLGLDPTPQALEHYLETELDLVLAYTRDYPRVPFAATRGSSFEVSRFAQITRFVLQAHTDADALARSWRLDYLDAYWQSPSLGDALHQVFRDRARSEDWEKLELDWGGNETLRDRWDDLQTEQAIATRIWREGRAGQDPTPTQLREIAVFLETMLERILASDASGPQAALASLFRLEGVDEQALHTGDKVAALFASRVWTQTMSGRVARAVSRAAAGTPLPGTAEDRMLIESVARRRYPDDGRDPLLRRLFDWLVIVDGVETYRELAAGYDKFFRELRDRGLPARGLARAPVLGDDELTRDLLDLWRALPARFPHVPAQDDMVAEFVAESAYLSTADGLSRRTPAQFVDDFADVFRSVDERMGETPPPIVQQLADRQMDQTQGRSSRSEAGRRFFAWWMCAQQAKILKNNLERHGVARSVDVGQVAAEWAETIATGLARWPHLPWLSAGFGDFFLQVREVEGESAEATWKRFDRQLGDADALAERHVVPFESFTAVVDRRISQTTGLPNFDPVLRQANAVLALAQLLHVARANGITTFDRNPGKLSERFSLLYEKLARTYPQLDWSVEGTVEYYLLVGLREQWDLDQLTARFGSEWSLANALAARGMLARMTAVAEQDGGDVAPRDRSLRLYVDAQSRRLADRTGVASRSARAKAMSAIIALSTIILSAGEEGQIPEQRGAAWSRGRVLAWARAQGRLSDATQAWAEGLVDDWSALHEAMRSTGPAFPWHKGAIVETNLLVMRNAGATVADMKAALAPSWKAAGDLVDRQVDVPAAFQRMVLRESSDELRRKMAAARGLPIERVSPDEVAPDDPALVPLLATLVLAEVVADVRVRYREDPDPVALANRILEVRTSGPERFPFLPWGAKGFVPSLVVSAYEPDFRDDFWKYARFADLAVVNDLLHDVREGTGDPARTIPSDVMDDVRTIMRAQTGRSPSSDEVVAFQVLRDGVFLLREFLTQAPLDLRNILTVVRLRAAVRGLSDDFPDLHIVATDDHAVRVGFAERLAVVAMKQALGAGEDLADPAFVSHAVALLQGKYLRTMHRIYSLVRESFSPEELQYYQESIRTEARADNLRRSAKYGLHASALSTPDVAEDDVVSDFALYEILYATEIGEDRTYLVDIFTIYDAVRRRPAFEHDFREGIASVDAPYASSLRPRGAPDYDRWASDPRYPQWLEARGTLVKKWRGRLTGLARTFALLKRTAFGPAADAKTRAAFARFGDFDAFLASFFDEFERVRRVPELAAALDTLEQQDRYLADGVQFALAIFSLHVLEARVGDAGDRERVLREIASGLPGFDTDYRRILGFSPRLESGVPLYDARVAFLRADIEPGPGNDVLRRLDLVQRSVQRWPEKYFIKHAYKVLFHRDLDEDDPTPVPREGWPHALEWLRTALDRWAPRTRGREVTALLEARLPRLLERETGSRDPGSWIQWLAKNGEVGLDGEPTGQNPYADEQAAFDRRLEHYRALIVRGELAGTNVRPEVQRVRDIEEERGSLDRQVTWLREAADHSARASQTARDDYARAIVTIAGLALLGLVAAVVAVLSRRGARQTRPRRAGLAFTVAFPLALGVAFAAAVAVRPVQTAASAERLLTRVGLVDRDDRGTLRPRGAAAQLAKSRPWEVLAEVGRRARQWSL